MQFRHIEPARIEREWPAFAEILALAVQHSAGKATLDGLFRLLISGKRHLLTVSEGANGAVVLDITEDGVCWVEFVAGAIVGGPHRRLQAIRSGITAIENSARNGGCTEVRYSGREWPLHDYQPVSGGNNVHRKVL